MSGSLRPHGLRHARLPCPSPTPGACSHSCPSSRWCHPSRASLVAQLVKNLPVMPETLVQSLGGEGKGYPLQDSSLENSMDCIARGVSKSWTWLSDFHFTVMCLNHPQNHSPAPRSVEKLSSMKQVPGVKKVGHCCLKTYKYSGSTNF